MGEGRDELFSAGLMCGGRSAGGSRAEQSSVLKE